MSMTVVEMAAECTVDVTSIAAEMMAKLVDYVPRKTMCGIYFLFYKEELVYVGLSVDCEFRVQTHWQERIKRFTHAKMMAVPECHLIHVESWLIDYYKPIYNRSKPYDGYSKHTELGKTSEMQNHFPQLERAVEILQLTDEEDGVAAGDLHRRLGRDAGSTPIVRLLDNDRRAYFDLESWTYKAHDRSRAYRERGSPGG